MHFPRSMHLQDLARATGVCALALAALTAPSVPAMAASKQLYNKSIHVLFSITIPAKGSDGSTINNPRGVNRVIYVSSQGRVFTRGQQNAGRNSQTRERGPGESNLQFSENRLVGVLPFISGASRLTISFDASFSSCSGEIITGAESGKPIVFTGLNGVTYTATGKPQVSAVSCSISEGNALAN